ncbi:chymotrypsinogen B-like [Ornithodoros turicata]|uniref:chymotrypsinogen B-like n=1 Tax=Ornithodoros turicata TaxID=34597 RepID=UPI003139F31A
MAHMNALLCFVIFLYIFNDVIGVALKRPRAESSRRRTSCGRKSERKIVDGDTLISNKYPWIVRISAYYRPIQGFQKNSSTACSVVKTSQGKLKSARYVAKDLQTVMSLCGGSLITPRHVLTAGHCLLPEEFYPRYVVHYGSASAAKQSTAFVSHVYKHPNCHLVNQDRAVDDVAVMVLRAPVPLSPVCLPRAGAPLPSEVTVAGWGNTIPSIDSLQLPELLKEAHMQVIPKEKCQEEHSYANLQHQICAEPSSGFPGVGDSGGPLMTQEGNGGWTVVGVVSWGNETRFRTSPFVFSDVTSLLTWIQDIVSLPV